MKLKARDFGRHWRELVLAFLYVAPVLALVVLGVLWLREHGYLSYFVASFLALTVAGIAVRGLWRPSPHGITTIMDLPASSEAERRARTRLQEAIDGSGPEDVESLAKAMLLAKKAALSVADSFYPGDKDAWLRVSVPEVLLMAEDVSRRLRQVLNADFPIVNHVSIRMILGVPSIAAKLIGVANAAKLARWFNPETAVMNQVKSALTDRLADGLVGTAKGRAAAMVVREVGEVTIRLYSGGYRKTQEEIESEKLPIVGVNPPPVRPVTILLAGQANAGKSCLLNALAGEVRVATGRTLPTRQFHRVEITHGDAGAVVLVDSPGIGGDPSKEWLKWMKAADLVVWTVAADRADRAADQKALRALRKLSEDDFKLGEVPLLLVVTHAARLNPPMEWQPPYDLSSGDKPKERSMRNALGAIARSLSFPDDRCVIVNVGEAVQEQWNVDALWTRLCEALPEAKRKQLERSLQRAGIFKTTFDFVKSIPAAATKGTDLLGM